MPSAAVARQPCCQHFHLHIPCLPVWLYVLHVQHHEQVLQYTQRTWRTIAMFVILKYENKFSSFMPWRRIFDIFQWHLIMKIQVHEGEYVSSPTFHLHTPPSQTDCKFCMCNRNNYHVLCFTENLAADLEANTANASNEDFLGIIGVCQQGDSNQVTWGLILNYILSLTINTIWMLSALWWAEISNSHLPIYYLASCLHNPEL